MDDHTAPQALALGTGRHLSLGCSGDVEAGEDSQRHCCRHLGRARRGMWLDKTPPSRLLRRCI